jgi:hypothetical protein
MAAPGRREEEGSLAGAVWQKVCDHRLLRTQLALSAWAELASIAARLTEGTPQLPDQDVELICHRGWRKE